MSRWSSSLNEAAASRSDIYGAFLLDLHFASGHLYCHDGGGDLTFGGNTYTGIGTFGTFNGVEESIEFIARGVRFELSGVESGLIATIIGGNYQGRPATLYVGLIDPSTHQFVDTPEVAWSGYMDTMNIVVNGGESTIVLQCEHRLRATPPYSRFSDADQRARHPGDRFFDLTHVVASYTSEWGGRATSWVTRPGGGYLPS